MEILKDIAAILGVILSAASVITLLSKTVRQGVISIFRRYGKTDEVTEDITEIKRLLEQHIEEDKQFKNSVSKTNDIMMEFTRT